MNVILLNLVKSCIYMYMELSTDFYHVSLIV